MMEDVKDAIALAFLSLAIYGWLVATGDSAPYWLAELRGYGVPESTINAIIEDMYRYEGDIFELQGQLDACRRKVGA